MRIKQALHKQRITNIPQNKGMLIRYLIWQLAAVTKSNAWLAVVKGMDQLLYTATKLHASKPQTRIQTLKLAERISAENAPPPPEAGSIQ